MFHRVIESAARWEVVMQRSTTTLGKTWLEVGCHSASFETNSHARQRCDYALQGWNWLVSAAHHIHHTLRMQPLDRVTDAGQVAEIERLLLFPHQARCTNLDHLQESNKTINL